MIKDTWPLIDNAPIGFVLFNIIRTNDGEPSDFIFTGVNKAFEQLLELSPSDVVGHKLSDVISYVNSDFDPGIFHQVAVNGEPRTMVLDITNVGAIEGTIYQPSPDELAVIFSNVTERENAHTALKRSEEMLMRYQLFSQNARDIILFVHHDGRILEANDAALNAYGYSHEELLALSIFDLRCDDHHSIRTQIDQAWCQGLLFETVHKRKDGSVFPVEVSTRGVIIGGQNVRLSIIRDISERKRAERTLRESERFLRDLFESANDIILMVAANGNIVDINSRAEEVTGYTHEELIRFNILHDLILPEDVEKVNNVIQKLLNGENQIYEVRWRAKNGTILHFEGSSSARMSEDGNFISTRCILRDITERKKAEAEREIILNLLYLANRPGSLHSIMKSLASYLREWSGCDAIGIRLRAGDDFPYYETQGFSRDFVMCENRLCADIQNHCPNNKVSPVLDCMCGCVISGRFDPSKPFFTERGSFWTNSTSELLASTTETDRQTRTRNRCNGEGYESVALISLRAGGECIGLLQLNDRRKGKFTPRSIELIEEIAGIIANVVARSQAEDALWFTQTAVDSAAEPMYCIDSDGHIIYANEAASRMLGYSDHELRSMVLADIDIECTPERWHEWWHDLEQQRFINFESVHRSKDGTTTPVEVNANYTEYNGKAYSFASARNIFRRKQVRQALQASEARYRGIVEDQTDFIVRYLPDSTITFVNDAICRYLGAARDEIVGTNMSDWVPEGAASEISRLTSALTPESPVAMIDHAYTLPSGELRWHQWTNRGLFDAEGNLIEIQAAGRDVTDQKNAAEALKARAQQQAIVAHLGQFALGGADLKTLFDNAAFLVAKGLGVKFSAIREISADGKTALLTAGAGWEDGCVNRSVVELTPDLWPGYSLMNNAVIVVEDLAAETRFRATDGLVEHGVVSGISVIIRGRNRPFGLLAAFSTQRKVFSEDDVHFMESIAYVLSMAVERKNYEAELRIHNSAINSTSDQVMITSSDGTVEFINPAFEREKGYTSAEVVGQHPHFLSSQDDSSHDFHDRQLAALRAGEGFQGEAVCMRKDGTRSIDDVTIAPVKNDAGEIEHLVVIMRDITEKKLHDEQMSQMLKMETVGRLAAGIAHDFNNLLQGILGYTRILIRNSDTQDPSRSDLMEVEKASLRASDLVRQIMMLARQVPTCTEPVDMAVLVREIATLCRSTFPRNITINCIPVSDCGWVEADASQIHQVLMNLCLNARDAMSNGGILTITADHVRLNNEFVNSNLWAKTGSYIRLSVTDTGRGMDEETKRRAFDPFFTTKLQQGGCGLGLSSCYGIVQSHGGFIHIDSVREVGTTVDVYLPVARRRVLRSRHVESAPTRGGVEVILVVDDENFIQTLTRRVLESVGYTVLVAGNGREALECIRARDGEIDLVLLDMNMPEMNGAQTLSAIRGMTPKIKVMITTGLVTDVENIAESERPDGIIQKPYKPETLLEAVREMLDRSVIGP